jgi:hypothetical protein
MKRAPDRNAFAQLVERSIAVSVCRTSTAMPLLTNTSSVSGQTWSRSQIALDSTRGQGLTLDSHAP